MTSNPKGRKELQRRRKRSDICIVYASGACVGSSNVRTITSGKFASPEHQPTSQPHRMSASILHPCSDGLAKEAGETAVMTSTNARAPNMSTAVWFDWMLWFVLSSLVDSIHLSVPSFSWGWEIGSPRQTPTRRWIDRKENSFSISPAVVMTTDDCLCLEVAFSSAVLRAQYQAWPSRLLRRDLRHGERYRQKGTREK